MLTRIIATSSILAAVVCLVSHRLHASPPEWDRRTAEQHGWIYDDFDAGLAKAKASGKPLLVVLRCPP